MLVILGLFSPAGAIVWLGLRMQPNGQLPSFSTSSSNPPNSQKSTISTSSVQALEQVALESDRNVDYNEP